MLKGEKLALYLIIVLALAFNAEAVYSPDQYTVALWHFDECNGTAAYDSSGNGNTGTLNNVAWTTDSFSGCAVSFNGVNSVINTAGSTGIDITNQLTLEAWVKRNSNTPASIISRNGPYYIAINPDFRFPTDGTIRVGVYTDNWHEFSSNKSLQVGQWYHIAMTYDGSELRIFINGVEDSSIPVTGQIIYPQSDVSIGCCQGPSIDYFDGVIDEARISNIARTSFEISKTILPLPIRINFQPPDAEVPENYLKSDGSAFSDFIGYGWDTDRTSDTRERKGNLDQRLDTLIHQCCENEPHAIFNVNVPNGLYNVKLASGDPSFSHPQQYIKIEDIFFLTNEGTTANEFIERTNNVEVNDGKLTLEMWGNFLNELGAGAVINYLEIRPSETTTTTVPANKFLYEDFSQGLDTDKWQEIPASDLNNDFLPEHYVLFNEEGIPYHTASRDPADRGVILKSTRQFLAGESIEYDVNYITDSGSGNRINIVDIDGSTRLFGLFGYWNGVEPAGNDYGLYHVKVTFTNTGADLEITRPDGSISKRAFETASQNHTFGFGTRTGHDGWVHMDYDNVYLTSPFITQTTTTTITSTTTSTIITTIPVYSRAEVDALLSERDARITALESRASLLEIALSNIRNTLTAIQNTVSNLFTSLFGLPKGLRQEMICSSMKATNQTFAQGFGLTCSINDKGACSCN